jgi:hypothetical protein
MQIFNADPNDVRDPFTNTYDHRRATVIFYIILICLITISIIILYGFYVIYECKRHHVELQVFHHINEY